MEQLESRALLASMPFINLTGGAGDDLLTITANGPDSGTFQLNGNPAVSFTDNQTFTFDGGGGADGDGRFDHAG